MKEAAMFDIAHFPKAKRYWHQGKFFDWSEARLHPMIHALHYGTSVFEGIRAYPTARGPAIFRLDDHTARFLYSAKVAWMKVPYTRRQIADLVKLTIEENNLEAAYVRPLFFYSYGNLGLVPKFCPVELVIATWEWGAYLGEKAKSGVSVYLVPWRRIHISQLDMMAKLGGAYVQSTISGRLARARGCDEAVFLNLEGRIAEGPGENIFIYKNGVLKTNGISESILEGITRTSLLEIAADHGIRTRVGQIRKDEMLAADEVFFSGTAVEVVAITHVVDGSDPTGKPEKRTIGSGRPGPVTTRLRELYMDAATGKIKKYAKWLSYVR
jgi:branched-chain amino acid aminotransferase